AMFASYRLLSTFFSAAELSSYFFLLSVSGLFGLLITNPIGMYLNRVIHRARVEQNLGSTVGYFFKLFTVTSLLMIPIVFVLNSKINESHLGVVLIMAILIVYVLGAALNGFFVSTLNILSQNIQFVSLISLTSVVGLGLSLGIVTIYDKSPLLWMLGQGIATVIFGYVALVMLKKGFPDKENSLFEINKQE